MKKITLLFFLLAVSFGYSQQVLIEDFESSPVLEAWSGAAVATGTDAVGANGQNMEVTLIAAAGDPWQGAKVTLPAGVEMDLTTNKTVKVDIYSTIALTIMGKVEGSGPASADDKTHGGSGWETITFDFASDTQDGLGAANGNYNLFAVFPNRDGAGGWGSPVIGSVTQYDNITAVLAAEDLCINGVQDPGEEGVDCGGTCPNACPSPPTTAAPTPPNRPAADVISLYSDAYTDVASNFDAGWCGGSSVAEIMVDGNATQSYLGNACQGIVLDAGVDASTFTKLHVDIFIEAGTDLLNQVFNLKFVNMPQPGPVVEYILNNTTSSPTLVTGSWISVDVDVDLSAITNFKEFGITSGLNGKVYYDNLYVHKDTVLGVDEFALTDLNVYPNPSNNVWNVKTNNTTMNSIHVFDMLGKQVLSLNPRSEEVQIDASTLNSGLYFAKIDSNSGSKTIKLIKN